MAKTQHPNTQNQQAASVLGLQALSWIASDEALFGGFLAQAGTDAADVRARATDPVFLGFVLDFILQEDATVIGFAENIRVSPEEIVRARHNLPGGDTPNWT